MQGVITVIISIVVAAMFFILYIRALVAENEIKMLKDEVAHLKTLLPANIDND